MMTHVGCFCVSAVSLSFVFPVPAPLHSDCNNLKVKKVNTEDRMNYDNQVDQYDKNCNDPLVKVSLLGFFWPSDSHTDCYSAKQDRQKKKDISYSLNIYYICF